MMRVQNLLTSLVFVASVGCATTSFERVVVDKNLTTNASQLKSIQSFAFGSCNKQYFPQPLWKTILKDKPDLFLWTGDVVYADTEDMGKLSQIYDSQLKGAEYSTFLQSGTPVIGTWDDHDYSGDSEDKHFKGKKESQSLFLDFVGEPENSERRKQDGLYTRYSFKSGQHTAVFIVLDTRTHRTYKDGGPDEDLLGDEQWKWLEKELSASEHQQVTFLVSSIQVLNTEQSFEKWSNFPKSYRRLFDLIEKSPHKNIMIISGDRHFAELTKQRIGTKDIWEITSSGLTHSFKNPDEARNKNSRRVGPVMDRLHYGLITLREKDLTIQIKDLNQTAAIEQKIPIL